MLAAAIIVFREVIEAGLIVGIVLAATRGVQSRTAYVLAGIAAGVFGASLLAVFAGTLSNALEGAGQEVFNASILGVAVIMLGWHNVWMAQHGRELAAELAAAGRAVVAGSKTLTALAIVVAVAVLREGAEVVLFLYGVVIASGESGWGLFAGGMPSHAAERPRLNSGRCEACFIRHRGICAALSTEQLERLSSIARRRTVPVNQHIFRDGDEAISFAAVVSGVVKLIKTTAEGERHIIGLAYAPEFLGHTFAQQHRFSAAAATDVDMSETATSPNDVSRSIQAAPSTRNGRMD